MAALAAGFLIELRGSSAVRSRSGGEGSLPSTPAPEVPQLDLSLVVSRTSSSSMPKPPEEAEEVAPADEDEDAAGSPTPGGGKQQAHMHAARCFVRVRAIPPCPPWPPQPLSSILHPSTGKPQLQTPNPSTPYWIPSAYLPACLPADVVGRRAKIGAQSSLVNGSHARR